MRNLRRIIATLVMVLGAAEGFAEIQPRGMMNGSGIGSGGAMGVIVAPNGFVITSRSTNRESVQAPWEIVAFKPDGTVGWTSKPGSPSHFVGLTNDFLLIGVMSRSMMDVVKGELVALRLSDGAVAWRITLDGVVMHVDSSPEQIYLVLFKANFGTMPGVGGMGPRPSVGSRNLMAISKTGNVLWTVTID